MPNGTVPHAVGTASTTPQTQFLAALDFALLSEEQWGASVSERTLESEIRAHGDVADKDVKAGTEDPLPPATMF